MNIHFINSAKLVETGKNVTEHRGATPLRSTTLCPHRITVSLPHFHCGHPGSNPGGGTINIMMNFKQYYTEARLQDNQTTEGVDNFIADLQITFPQYQNIMEDIKSVILSTKCPSIAFEPLRGALGISKHDKCIINTQILLNMNITYALYVIFHELAHQKQYSKYGEDIAADIFLDNISADEAAKKLLSIENTADRWSQMITTRILNKHGIKVDHIPMMYKNVSFNNVKLYVENIRKLIKTNRITTIEQANNLIYSMIKF